MKNGNSPDKFSYCEWSFWRRGLSSIAGVDEVGRGPLAGPVVAAAVIFPPEVILPGVTDSKQLSPQQRLALFPRIKKTSLTIGLGILGPNEIDRINILQASLQAMGKAVRNLKAQPDLLLVDGNHFLDLPLRQQCLIKGDRLSHAIGAASILAKVVRDLFMEACHHRFPVYNFRMNKGYGTREHLAALDKHGPCSLHRLTFRGVLSGERSTPAS